MKKTDDGDYMMMRPVDCNYDKVKSTRQTDGHNGEYAQRWYYYVSGTQGITTIMSCAFVTLRFIARHIYICVRNTFYDVNSVVLTVLRFPSSTGRSFLKRYWPRAVTLTKWTALGDTSAAIAGTGAVGRRSVY